MAFSPYSYLLETYLMHFNLQDIYTFASKILRGTNSEFRRNVLIEINNTYNTIKEKKLW